LETPQHITEVFTRYLANRHSAEDFRLLQAYFQEEASEETLRNLILAELESDTNQKDTQGVDRIIANADRNIAHALRKRRRSNTLPYTIAASIIAALAAISIYYFAFRDEQYKVFTGDGVYTMASTIAPGTNNATLTLANGKVIDLSTAQNGTIANESGINISKTANGEIVYDIANTGTSHAHNTITTPNGGQYTLRLPDGSKVWLNAASSLRYQTNMSQPQQRVVELNGEAYFEVAHNKAKPFIVKTARQQVEVLGTHFNINSYADEANTITTLAEGSVRVSNDKLQQLLKPGQQSIAGNSEILVQPADMEQALAWKNDEIRFKSENIANILRPVARWYNIEVGYEGKVPSDLITGGLSRKDNLDVFLRVLQVNGIDFKMEKMGSANKLIITGSLQTNTHHQ